MGEHSEILVVRPVYARWNVGVADLPYRPWWYSYPSAVHDLSALNAAVERMREDVYSNSFVPWKFYAKDQVFEPNLTEDRTYIHVISLEQSRTSTTTSSDESYTLTISEDGHVSITFVHPLGGIRALSTLTQLFYKHSEANVGVYTPYAPLAVEDAPAFAHRGLNLDISRNIITPREVMRTIEALAFNKFNRLHLHTSDAQSWPLEIPALPDLASKGAYHEDQIWSVADLHEVQNFGSYRGVEVYLEIDMPGHTASVHAAYPDLIESYNRQPWPDFSAQPCAGQLKLHYQPVTDFITTLLNDLLPRTAPFSPLFHLGGDEVYARAYDMSPFELKPHLQSFIDHAISLVHSHSLTPVVWEEHLLDFNLSLPSDTIVQVWRASMNENRSALAEVVGRGHRALFGAYTHWYLDCGHGGWRDPDPKNPDSPVKSPYLDYCGPLKNWREVYDYDPLADIPKSQRHLVVGGEVHMWAEQTDGANLDNNLWPRVSAAGEVLWRGKGVVSEDVTRRLAEMREWLVASGIAAGPVQVTWCLMNPGNCMQ